MILMIIQHPADRFGKIPESTENVRSYLGTVNIEGFDQLIESSDWFDHKVLEDLEGIISGELCPGPPEAIGEIRDNILGSGIKNLREGNYVFINRRIYQRKAEGWKRIKFTPPKV